MLIEKFKSINPYNRNTIPSHIKEKAYILINYLKLYNNFIPYEEDQLTEEQKLKDVTQGVCKYIYSCCLYVEETTNNKWMEGFYMILI